MIIHREHRLLASLAVVVVACQGASSGSSSAQVVSTAGGALAGPQSAQIQSSRRTAVTEAVARVAPAVVTVQTEVVQRGAVDPFSWFFGDRSGERVSAGLGSGFIVRPDGVIVTNAHVVAGATRVSVATRDGTTYQAAVVGLDEVNDLAVLKIDARDMPVAPLGDSSTLLIGEWAIAIGNPYGFVLGNTEPSVSVGVISGTGRNLLARAEGSGAYVDMIQTDAAINPGNSGGPLVDAAGEVIGVNSSIYSPSGSSIGLGFAIPVNRAARVTEELLANGRIARPWIGVKLQLADSATVRGMLTAGVTVQSVVPGSPAARAGVRPGDVIVRAGRRVLRNPFDWEAELLDLRVGETVPLVVRRGARETTIPVRVADLPEVSAPRVTVLREMELVSVTPAIRAQRSIASRSGALVVSASTRIQEEIGLQPGDVIVAINRSPISGAPDVARALDEYAGRGITRIFFERGGRVFATDMLLR